MKMRLGWMIAIVVTILLAAPLLLDTGPPMAADQTVLTANTRIVIDSHRGDMVVDTYAGLNAGAMLPTGVSNNSYSKTALTGTCTPPATARTMTERNIRLRHHAGKMLSVQDISRAHHIMFKAERMAAHITPTSSAPTAGTVYSISA